MELIKVGEEYKKMFLFFYSWRDGVFPCSVINDVINSVRESFLDESVDENVLLELKVQ